MVETEKTEQKLDELFKAGAHFGFAKSRRHPTVASHIFGSKNRIDIFDLEKTQESLSGESRKGTIFMLKTLLMQQ